MSDALVLEFTRCQARLSTARSMRCWVSTLIPATETGPMV